MFLFPLFPSYFSDSTMDFTQLKTDDAVDKKCEIQPGSNCTYAGNYPLQCPSDSTDPQTHAICNIIIVWCLYNNNNYYDQHLYSAFCQRIQSGAAYYYSIRDNVPYETHARSSNLKGHWTTSASSPNFFRKVEIFISLEVYTYVVTAC